MQNWKECSVKYSTIDEKSGKEKTVTEKYLIDAISFTEAEKRFTDELTKMGSFEFDITAIKKENYAEVYNYQSGEHWYKATVSFEDMDGKKATNKMLIYAESIENARERITEKLSDWLVDYEIEAIIKTKIIDVFLYEIEKN